MSDSRAYSPKLFAASWIEFSGAQQEGPFGTDSELIAAIHEQERALLQFANVHPFSGAQLAELRMQGSIGGAEHEVFVREAAMGESRVWKLTKKGRWGLLRATPLEYLLRLDQLDQSSGTDIRVEGVVVDTSGLPLLVTSMDYVHGEHPSPAALDQLLHGQGWEKLFDPDQMLSYRHKTDGIVMRDAHSKNFILMQSGALVPIDVIFTH